MRLPVYRKAKNLSVYQSLSLMLLFAMFILALLTYINKK
ncbi:putative holin-like toxin [Lactococcus lactis]|nr:putative holin-like toxin [Lactococcus lactis]MDT2898850.1 putative holin-like toxin [Lactococcus lactis]